MSHPFGQPGRGLPRRSSKSEEGRDSY
jgi:hypothetical protein